MGWKKIIWCGVEVYVQRNTLSMRFRRWYDDHKIKKLRKLNGW